MCQIWNQIIAVTIIKLRKAALLSLLHLYYIHEVARSQLLETRGKRIVSSRRYNTHKMLKSSCVPSKIPCVCTFPYALMFPGAWLHANSIVPALLYFLLFWTRLTTLYSKIKAHPPINPQLCHNAGIYCLFGVWNLSNKKKKHNKKAFQKLEEKQSYFPNGLSSIFQILLWLMNGVHKQKPGICSALIAWASWIIDAKWGLRVELSTH